MELKLEFHSWCKFRHSFVRFLAEAFDEIIGNCFSASSTALNSLKQQVFQRHPSVESVTLQLYWFRKIQQLSKIFKLFQIISFLDPSEGKTFIEDANDFAYYLVNGRELGLVIYFDL